MYVLKSKDEATECFNDFKNLVEKQTGCAIKMLRSDNGREFVNKKMQSFLRQHGIVHQKTIAYNPQQNGVAERRQDL